MEENQNTYFLKKIIDFSQGNSTFQNEKELMEELKRISSSDTELVGLKYFLEDHNYNLSDLNHFLHGTNKKIVKRKIVDHYTLMIAAMFFVICSIGILFAFLSYKTKYINKYLLDEPGIPVFASAVHKITMDDLGSAY